MPTGQISTLTTCSSNITHSSRAIGHNLQWPHGSIPERFGSEQIFIILCIITKYVESFPSGKATPEIVISRMWETLCRWGICRTILVDNGTQYTSNSFQEFCHMLKISVFQISAYMAHANMTERYNSTITDIIVTFISNHSEWD